MTDAGELGSERRGRVGDHVRAAILEEAIDLVAERGADVSMAELAAAAGVGRATLYRYFPTREDLSVALMGAAIEEASARIAEARLEEVPLEEAVERAARALLTVGSRYLVIVREHLGRKGELEGTADPRHEERVGGPLTALFRRGQEEGVLRADVPFDWLKLSFRALVLSALDLMHASDLGVEDAAQLVTRQFLDGARPPAPAAGRAT